jgi:hypothetical protein
MTTEQLKSEVERGNVDRLADYAFSLACQQAKAICNERDQAVWNKYQRTSDQLKASIRESLYYLRLGETGRATEILNQALSV